MKTRDDLRSGGGHRGPGAAAFGTVLVLVFAAGGADAAVRYVTPGGGGDCGSWANSCGLQTALGGASMSDQIWVAAGTYTPGSARTDSFHLTAGVEVYGGFVGGESSLEERDWAANETILSGDIGVVDDPTDNSYHVVTISAADLTTVLDGFTVTGGRTPNTWPHTTGAGFYGDGGGATLRHLTIRGNRASTQGGGIWNQGGDVVIERSVIENNALADVDGDGCGVHSAGGSLVMKDVTVSGCTARIGGGINVLSFGTADLTDVLIEGCWANARGGGLATAAETSVSLTRVQFIGNTGYSGGGLANAANSPGIVMVDVDFIRNHSGDRGGGMHNDGAAHMTNVRFLGNSAGRGGGLNNLHYGAGYPTVISNALFVGNTSLVSGGGFNNEISDSLDSMHLINATFVANHANQTGGGFHNLGALTPDPSAQDVLLVNSVLRGNTAGSVDSQIESSYDAPTVSYSLVQGGYGGAGNLDDDPLFLRSPDPGADLEWGTADDDYGDLRVDAGSPVIDAGDSSVLTATIALGHAPRTVDDPAAVDVGVGSPVVDMGPYERLGIFADGFESGDSEVWH